MLSRRLRLGLAAVLLALAACGKQDSSSPATAHTSASVETGRSSTIATSATAPPAHNRAKPKKPRAMSLEQTIGQRLVTGYHGATPTASVLRTVRTGHVGGVILFGDNVPTLAAARSAIRALEHAASAGHQPDLFVMVDQEGGNVKRLAELPPELSPAQMGSAQGVERKAKAEGLRTARALRKIGVNVDLAPVADVPDGPGSFLGTRAFSQTPEIAAHGACGFASGLARGGVAGTLKHFPGLGRARGNTDLKPIAVTAARGALEADLAAYRRCARHVPLVMIASASYPALGIDRPAVLSPRTYSLLKGTGFHGITITDAFDTPAITNQTRPARAALRAGVDLLLYGPDEAGAQRAFVRLLADAGDGGLSGAALRATATRILALKRQLKSRSRH